MLRSKRTLLKLVVAILLGAALGTLLGQLIGLVLPEGVVKEFFLRTGETGFSPTALNLGFCTLTIGFALHINVIGVIGIAIAIYVLRWY